MISYDPLRRLMEKQKITSYDLRAKAHISGSTWERIKENESVSTNTIDTLCAFLDCAVSDIMEFIRDESAS